MQPWVNSAGTQSAQPRAVGPSYFVFSEEGRLLQWSGGLPLSALDLDALRRALARGVGSVELSLGTARFERLVPGGTLVVLEEVVEGLSERQRAVAQYAAAGATSLQIAETLHLSAHTVRHHLKTVYRRLGVSSRLELSRALRR